MDTIANDFQLQKPIRSKPISRNWLNHSLSSNFTSFRSKTLHQSKTQPINFSPFSHLLLQKTQILWSSFYIPSINQKSRVANNKIKNNKKPQIEIYHPYFAIKFQQSICKNSEMKVTLIPRLMESDTHSNIYKSNEVQIFDIKLRRKSSREKVGEYRF